MRQRSVPLLLWVLAAYLLAVLGPAPLEIVRLDRSPAQLAAHPDAVLSDVAAVIAWGLLLWLAIGWLAVLGSVGRGRMARGCDRLATVLLPRTLRGLLEGTVGLTVLLSAAPTALAATPVAATTATAAETSVADAAVPLPSLDRSPVTALRLTPVPAVPAPVLAPAPRPSAPDPVLAGRLPDTDPEVVVRRGDCLWSVVARALGPEADDAMVAEAWPHWYAANRSVIGPDPGRLLPGQRLTPPGSTR